MSNKPVFIYALVDPRDDSIFYVGASVNPELRLYQHRWCYFTGQALKVVIAELDACGIKIGVRVLEEANDQNRDERESYWIAKLQAEGLQLTNKGNPANVQQMEGRARRRALWAARIQMT
jgi:hypothetical protein